MLQRELSSDLMGLQEAVGQRVMQGCKVGSSGWIEPCLTVDFQVSIRNIVYTCYTVESNSVSAYFDLHLHVGPRGLLQTVRSERRFSDVDFAWPFISAYESPGNYPGTSWYHCAEVESTGLVARVAIGHHCASYFPLCEPCHRNR